MSETASCRAYLQRFCQGIGLDLGFGGDPIREDSITVDNKSSTHPSFLGDAANLHWFKDGCFDYVFSSHLLEDFVDTGLVLEEWLRVIRPGGCLVLFLPDQKVYESHCRIHGVIPNQDHKHPAFSLKYLLACLGPSADWVIHTESPVTYNPYSFAVVVRKPALTTPSHSR